MVNTVKLFEIIITGLIKEDLLSFKKSLKAMPTFEKERYSDVKYMSYLLITIAYH